MKIRKNSMIYKFQENALVADENQSVPENLCPYMRRFLRLVIGTTFVGVGIAGMIFAPVILYFDVVVNWLLAILVIWGSVGWGLLVFAGMVSLVLALFTDATPIGARIHGGLSSAREKIRGNIFVQWYRAIHDKICPSLTFVGEKDV
jgi:hypothetical protein